MGIVQNFKEADRKTKGIYLLILLVIVLLIVGTVWLVRVLTAKPEPVTQPIDEPIVVTQEMLLRQQELTINPVAIDEQRQEQIQQADLRIIAEPFLERFGSYNNQDNFRNFEELRIYTTASFQQWIDTQYRQQLRSQMPSLDTYYAINTKVLSSEGVEFLENGSRARMRFSTQRQIVAGFETEPQIQYQDARVELELVDGAWKVYGVFWL